MKKLISLLLVLSLIILIGCNNNSNNNNNNNGNNKVKELKISDYFPFKENMKYTYEGEGNEYASYTLIIDYIAGSKVQARTYNGGTETVRVIEYKNGELIELLRMNEVYYRQNFTDTANSDGKIILKEPLTKNNNWVSKNSDKSIITNIDVDIKTPMGNYKALEVTTEGKDYKVIDYYAKDIGLIKTITTGNNYEVSSTLSKVETDIPLSHNIILYYPDLEKDVIYALNTQVSFKTNDDAKKVIEKAIKDTLKEKSILSKNTTINSLNLREDGIVHADFSKELIAEMNAGSSYELMILQSITNTLGNYYGTDRVYITIEGEPYESGHILMEKNEPFKVNLDNVENLE